MWHFVKLGIGFMIGKALFALLVVAIVAAAVLAIATFCSIADKRAERRRAKKGVG